MLPGRVHSLSPSRNPARRFAPGVIVPAVLVGVIATIVGLTARAVLHERLDSDLVRAVEANETRSGCPLSCAGKPASRRWPLPCAGCACVVLLMVGGCALSILQQLQPKWYSFWSYYAVSPHGNEIYIVKNGHGFGGIYRVDLQRPVAHPVIDTDDQERDVSVSPDGRYLTYVSVVRDEIGRLCISNSDGTGVRQLTNGSSTCAAVPVFSPDGKSILFARAVHRHEYAFGGHMVWDTWDVCRIPITGGPVKPLTNVGYFKMHRISVSYGSHKIVYSAVPSSGDSADDVTFAIDANGGVPETMGPKGAFEAALSPDGSRMTYVKLFTISYDYDVWISDCNGAHARQLTRGMRCQQPSFSADGKSIYYLGSLHDRAGYDLHFLDLAGGKDTVIVPGTVFDEPAQ